MADEGNAGLAFRQGHAWTGGEVLGSSVTLSPHLHTVMMLWLGSCKHILI